MMEVESRMNASYISVLCKHKARLNQTAKSWWALQ